MNINTNKNLSLVASEEYGTTYFTFTDQREAAHEETFAPKITQVLWENLCRKVAGKVIEEEKQARWKEQQSDRDHRRLRYEKSTGRGQLTLGALGLI
jgi:hypothetical protein